MLRHAPYTSQAVWAERSLTYLKPLALAHPRRGETPIIVATIAFGMGVNKRDAGILDLRFHRRGISVHKGFDADGHKLHG